MSCNAARCPAIWVAIAGIAFGGCAQNGSNMSTTDVPGAHNTLTAQERQQGWRLLFDGSTTSGWRNFNADSLRPGWAAVDGALTRVARSGDIITLDQFGDFELTLDWKVRAAGNSGIFFRVVEGPGAIYHYAPEFQVLDDAGHADGRSELTSAGANYALHPAPRGVVKPAEEWNTARIVARGNHIEHWLNGIKVVDYELDSDDWKQRVANSKFNAWPQFSKAMRGHIGLQEHGDWVAFRNIKIRPL